MVGALTVYDYKFHESVGSRFKSGCVKQGKQRHNRNAQIYMNVGFITAIEGTYVAHCTISGSMSL
jgi:hypothetical protein